MERGLFAAASGMLADQIRQDVIANNLANATTAGFKGDVAVGEAFPDMLVNQLQTGAKVGDARPRLAHQPDLHERQAGRAPPDRQHLRPRGRRQRLVLGAGPVRRRVHAQRHLHDRREGPARDRRRTAGARRRRPAHHDRRGQGLDHAGRPRVGRRTPDREARAHLARPRSACTSSATTCTRAPSRRASTPDGSSRASSRAPT